MKKRNWYEAILSVVMILILAIAVAPMLMGCAGMKPIPLNERLEKSVCNFKNFEGKYADTWICQVCIQQMYITPEEAERILLDANAILILVDTYEAKDVERYIVKLYNKVKDFPQQLTWAALITYALKEQEKARLAAQIINRNIQMFYSEQTINLPDFNLIIWHLREQLRLVNPNNPILQTEFKL